MSDAIAVALITTWAGLVSVLINWLMNVRQRERGEAHAAEITRLKSELASSEERLRSTLARDLASHEALLRTRGELRMKLFVMAAESVTSAKSCHARIIDILSRYIKDLTPTPEAVKLWELLFASAPFLPPELDQLHDAMIKHVGLMLTALGPLSPDERSVGGDQMMHEFGAVLGHFARGANDWKKRHWAEFADGDLSGGEPDGT